ncbi:MAG: hypothetical protein ACK2UO_16220 [Caldilineaceae bacterium]
MQMTFRNRPATLFVLLALLIFLGAGGLVGGASMLSDPSGQGLGLPPDLLDPVPIDDYLLPGIFLLTIMGVCPLFAAYGAWALPRWGLLQRLNPWPDFHWSWSWSRIIAAVLILFIGLEFLLWGNASPLQPILLAVGLGMLVMCGYPSIRRYMRMRWETEPGDGRATLADQNHEVNRYGDPSDNS